MLDILPNFKISTILSSVVLRIIISNTNNIKKFWVGIFKGQSHISKGSFSLETGVSQLRSQLVTRVANDQTRVR